MADFRLAQNCYKDVVRSTLKKPFLPTGHYYLVAVVFYLSVYLINNTYFQCKSLEKKFITLQALISKTYAFQQLIFLSMLKCIFSYNLHFLLVTFLSIFQRKYYIYKTSRSTRRCLSCPHDISLVHIPQI